MKGATMDNDSMHGGRVSLSLIIRSTARAVGDIVTVDYRYDTVDIDGEYFLQGDEAAEFIDSARRLYDEAQYVTMDECYAHIASQYL